MGTVSEVSKLIVFKLEEEEFAVPVDTVGSIEKIEHITRVPGTPNFIKGVINLRGVVTPVIDLRQRFHSVPTVYTEQSRIIIVDVNDIGIGLIVEAANDVLDISTELIEAPPEVVGSEVAAYISGVVKYQNRLLILLDLERVLSNQEMDELKALDE